MKQLLVITIAILVGVTSCSKSESEENLPAEVDLAKMQTQCSDSWGLPATTNEEVIRDYFKRTYDIELIKVEIKYVETDPVCLACSCPSGNIIRITANRDDLSFVQKEGFKRGS